MCTQILVQVGAYIEQGFGCCSADGLNQRLVSSVAQAKNSSCRVQFLNNICFIIHC